MFRSIRSRFHFSILFAISLCFFVSSAYGQINLKENQNRNSLPSLFDSSRGKGGCCSGEKKKNELDIFNAVEFETYGITATYYKLSENLTTTLMLNNKGPEPILATPKVYSMWGTRIILAPITVPAASYLDVDMNQLLASAGPEFREGSLKINYQGFDYQLGAQVKMVNEENGLIWAEQLVYTSKFVSNRLESVWWLPNENMETRLVVSNTSYSSITVTLGVDGTTPQQTAPVQITLASSETRVLDIMADLVGSPNGTLENKGGVSISHTGNPGAVLARMFVAKPSHGYSAAIPFVDPDNTVSQKWHGNGLRLKNINGASLTPLLIARNTGGQVSRIRGKIPYTRPNGEMAAVDIPLTQIAPDSTKIINLQALIDSANVHASVKHAGIELEYDTPKGSVLTQVQSMSSDGNHVFQVPMFDPQKTPTSAGGYPWKADGDFHTLLYIKNETDQPKQYTAFLLWEGGGYALGNKELKRNQTVAIDFRELRDSQTPDATGIVIPLNLEKGQIAWSVAGNSDKILSGRSEQISISQGVASTYDCRNCCPNSFWDGWLDPFSEPIQIGGDLSFVGIQQDVNCMGSQMPTYPADILFWSSNDGGVAIVDNFGHVTGVGTGTTNIWARWNTVTWWDYGMEYCESTVTETTREMPVEVIPQVTITKADGSALSNPHRIGISGGGNNRKQPLVATVTPPEDAPNVTIEVSSKITLSNIQRLSGGIITFDVVGNSESPSNSCSGDSFIRAKHSGSTLANKTVLVVVPSKVATPHDTTGTYVAANRVLDAGTSPAFQGLPSGQVALATIFARFLTITVKDQCNNLVGDVYTGANVTETVGTSNVSINQQLTSASTYSDPVGGLRTFSIVQRGSAAALGWPEQPLQPMVSGSETQYIAVQVDGFTLVPGIADRTWTATPPNTLTITWPN